MKSESEPKSKTNALDAGADAYARWREKLFSDPEFATVYDEEASKSELWLQLVEARHRVGLTQAELADRLGVSQAQVARIEKRGYDAYTLTTLRKYVQALGGGFELLVSIQAKDETASTPLKVAS